MSMRAAGCALALLAVGTGTAEESATRLVDAPGREAVETSCLTCHSADYIVMNSPFLDAEAWRRSVTKMIEVMRAPITPEQADAIVKYLAANYGASGG